MLNDTIRNNMLWSKPDPSDDEIWKALEKSNAVDFVKDTSLSFLIFEPIDLKRFVRNLRRSTTQFLDLTLHQQP